MQPDFYELRKAGQLATALSMTYTAPKMGDISACGILTASLVEVHYYSECIRNFADSRFEDSNCYRDLKATMHMFNDDQAPHNAAGRLSPIYRDLFDVDIARAERMFKTLSKLERKQKKQSEELGSPDSIGEAFRRFAVCVGAKYIIMDKEGETSRGWSFDDNKHMHVWLSLGDGKDAINRTVWSHYETHGTQRAA